MLKTAVWLLASLGLAGVAAADDRAPMKNGTYADHQKAWSKFAIQGVQLGAPLEHQAGFTCGPPPGTDGFTTQNHSCVKFTDDRCKGRPTKIHHIRSSADLPKGQTCFMDEMNAGAYLDRALMQPTLRYLRVVGTDTTAPLIFRIEYTFAADDLTPDSNLGKALIAKYGAPSYAGPPTAMSWSIGDVSLSAACRQIGGDRAALGELCTITVEDGSLDGTERSLQEQANADRRKAAAPEAPPL